MRGPIKVRHACRSRLASAWGPFARWADPGCVTFRQMVWYNVPVCLLMRDTSVTLCDTSLYCTQEFLGLCRPQCARANRSRRWPSELMRSAFLVGLPVLGVLLCIIYILILFPLLGKLCVGHLVGFSKRVQLCSTGGVAPCLLILFFLSCVCTIRWFLSTIRWKAHLYSHCSHFTGHLSTSPLCTIFQLQSTHNQLSQTSPQMISTM